MDLQLVGLRNIVIILNIQTKYDEGVYHAIMLVSRTSVVNSVRMEDDTPEIFDIWIWGPTADGDYKEVEIKMSLSTVEELSVLLDYLKY